MCRYSLATPICGHTYGVVAEACQNVREVDLGIPFGVRKYCHDYSEIDYGYFSPILVGSNIIRPAAPARFVCWQCHTPTIDRSERNLTILTDIQLSLCANEILRHTNTLIAWYRAIGAAYFLRTDLIDTLCVLHTRNYRAVFAPDTLTMKFQRFFEPLWKAEIGARHAVMFLARRDRRMADAAFAHAWGMYNCAYRAIARLAKEVAGLEMFARERVAMTPPKWERFVQWVRTLPNVQSMLDGKPDLDVGAIAQKLAMAHLRESPVVLKTMAANKEGVLRDLSEKIRELRLE